MAISSLMAQLLCYTKASPTQSQSQLPDSSETRLHLYGLRGILALCGVTTVFVQTFIPALVSSKAHGPAYQKVLRIIFSPVIWDEPLITSFFLVLSCHSIALRFLGSPTPASFSGSIIRRVIRMALVISLSCGLAFGIFGGVGTAHIDQFKQMLPNEQITAPQIPENGLVALNAIFNIFWVVRDFYSQAANTLWPTQTLWTLSLIFYQSWTVYFLMIILPYTRPSWHSGALALFALGSFWICSWGWYSAAALLLADYVKSPTLRIRLDEGLMIYKRLEWKLPYSFVGGVMIVAGFAMRFTWAVLPRYYNKELILRPSLHLSENNSVAGFAAGDPYARLDNFFVIFGILLLSETSALLRRCLSCKPLVFLGKRSLSAFGPHSTVLFYQLTSFFQASSSRRASSFGLQGSSCTCISMSNAGRLHQWQS
jgi:hypothetical protein